MYWGQATPQSLPPHVLGTGNTTIPTTTSTGDREHHNPHHYMCCDTVYVNLGSFVDGLQSTKTANTKLYKIKVHTILESLNNITGTEKT
jgi:hypothetical protein